MSGYIENEIVEANRLRSQEALSGNNENPAQWTNTLSNIYELNAGDKVSMYSGFISERGAGSLKTIELKGKSLGKKKKFTYITENTIYEPVSKVARSSVVTQVIDEEIELKDNEANLILNYYKNTNGTGYIGLPRKGVKFTDTGEAQATPPTGNLPSVPYNSAESTTTGYISPIPDFNFMIKNDYQICVYNAKDDLIAPVVKVKNDNTKFTLFISRYSTLGSNDFGNGTINSGFDDANEPLQNWTIAPEYREYYVYRQKLPINIDKGFNSAQFIADDLTQKLQGIISERKQVYRGDMNKKEINNATIDIPVNKIVESETYKTFNCGSQHFWQPEAVSTLGDGTTDTTWYNNYQIIGWKRPELYENGQFVNMNASNDGTKLTTTQDRLLGSSLRQQYNLNDSEPLRTNIPYTKDNLLKLKQFIDAQSLYPEIWESWNDEPISTFDTKAQVTYGTPKSATENFDYNHTHTINNTRFFHMNTIKNLNMVEIDIDYLAVNSAVEYAHTTLKSAYTSGFLLIDLPWNGTDEIFNPSTGTGTPVGDYYYMCSAIVNIGGVNETVVIQEADGDSINQTQTLGLASTFSTALSVDTPVTIKYITVSSQLNVLKNMSSLGSSLYRPTHADPLRTNDNLRYSKLFLVYYNPADKDTYYDKPDIDKNKLTYGCFTKEEFTYTNTLDGGASITADFINIHPSVRIADGQSIDLDFAHWLDGDSTGFIEVDRKFGYDLHFTACCNPAIALYNGKQVPINYYGESIVNGITSPIYGAYDNTTNSQRSGVTNTLSEYVVRRYVGADNPSITWDGEHFGISDLHTGENLSSRSADGGRYIPNPPKTGGASKVHSYIVSGVPDDGGDPVYIINPFQNLDEFCPAIVPYLEQVDVYARDSTPYTLNEFNLNYVPFNVYDSKSGIFLEDMGYDEDTWDDGLWGIMGFTYEQFNGANNTRILRVDNNNIKSLKYPTTNADIKVTNTKNWDTNENGIPHFTDNLPTPFSLYKYDDTSSGASGDWGGEFLQIYPNINVKTSSIQLRAENFPTSMIKGYYTIRSNIVPQSVFVGGRSNITNMPIVGTITKENPQADYFFAGESNIEFTIGKPTKLSSITVSIHDPDGSYANVNNSSSVLFKIQRQMNVSFNVIGDILQKKNTKKSKL